MVTGWHCESHTNHSLHITKQRRLFFFYYFVVYFYCACAEEGDNDGDTVDGELELKELGDTIVDIAAPHDGLDNRREVVVSQNDVGRLLGHVRACNTLQHTFNKS